MIGRIFGNWRTTSVALVIIIGLMILIGMDKVQLNELTGIITLIVGGGAAAGFALSKDGKKTQGK